MAVLGSLPYNWYFKTFYDSDFLFPKTMRNFCNFYTGS